MSSASISSVTSNLFIQLRVFCSNIEIDARRLRQQLSTEHKPVQLSSAQDQQDTEFVNSLILEIDSFKEKLNAMQDKTQGPQQSRLSQVTVTEILDRCAALHSYNTKMVEVVAARIAANANAIAIANTKEKTPSKAPGGDANDENACNTATRRTTRSSFGAAGGEGASSSSSSSSSSSFRRNSRGGTPRGTPRGTPSAAAVAGNDEVESADKFAHASVDDGCSLQSILTPIAASAPKLTTPSSALSDEEGSKTPVLADWKLSEATRALVGVARTGGGGGAGSPRPSLIPILISASKERAGDMSSMIVSAGPFSTAKKADATYYLDQENPMMAMSHKTPDQRWSSPVSSGNTPETPQMDSPLMKTLLKPVSFPTTAEKSAPDLSDISGVSAFSATKPTHSQTKAQTPYESATPASAPASALAPASAPASASVSKLRTPGSARSFGSLSSKATPALSVNVSANYCNSSPAMAALNARLDDDSDEEEMPMASPPRSVALLEPRANAGLGACFSHDFIPLLSDAEWQSVPAFLKAKSSLAEVNTALGRLNAVIVGDTRGASFLPQETVTDVIGDNSKHIIMLLCYIKKLDVVREEGLSGFAFKR